jgi:hypothetical protein
MIFWIASYPKNGNTWLRTLLCAYYFTKDGFFSDDALLKNIGQFPEKKYFDQFEYKINTPGDTSRLWIKAQENINRDKKIRFFKTHNFLGGLGGNEFTDLRNTIGAVYIVRDPRNVITSLKNHFELSYDEALKFMQNEKKFTYDYFKGEDYSDFQFISSWENNYKSWINNKAFPTKIIKYENLSKETYYVFKDLINFVDRVFKNKNKFNKKKAQNSLLSTSFLKLKELENKKGFLESVSSINEKKKIPFFHLGPENDWKKKFDNEFKNKLNDAFKKNLTELNY